jgi:hypothetical protein
MEQSSTSHPNNKKRYLLAKASNRIFSRLIDSFFVVSVCIALGVVVLNGDPKGISNANDLQDHWRYIVIGVITAICFFCYFIVLPFC